MLSPKKKPQNASESTGNLHKASAKTGVSDAVLVSRVLQGEREAYRDLVEKYQSALVACAWQRVHNREDAEEAAQEAFVLGFERLRKLREPKYFFTWVWRICANVALKAQRKARRAKLGLVEEMHGTYEADAPVEIDERNQTLMLALETLPEEQRMVLTLRFWEGMAYGEMAELLGLSHDALYQRVSRGLKALRETLGDEFIQDV
ncbi:MAG: sigma-70 family RNA polymerase sigma factor [Planctomycetes bacterium]|nr:sigma-70 family RNA polymerase sigma factor [Planctomycetota bacterium]